MLGDFAATFGRWRIWYVLANQDIYMRYRRSVLGPFWISFSLAAVIIGLGLLYGILFGQPFAEYASFLAPGLLAWYFINGAVMEGTSAIIENEAHMRSVPIPISVTAARVTFRNFVIFLHNGVVVIAVVAYLKGLTPTAFLALGGAALYVLLAYFTAITLAPLCTRFRDVPQVLGSLMQMVFFLSPVMWRPVQLPENVRIFAEANPFYHIIQLVRAPLMGVPPSVTSWIVGFSALGVLMLLAMVSISVSRKRVFLWI